MPARKRRKFSRMRGHGSHGWGHKKKHRGAGSRGGRGMAGSGKRADQKKPTILKLFGNEYFGKHGFCRPSKVVECINAINISQLQVRLDYYVSKKLIDKDGDVYVIDLKKIGYQKVLGKGNLTSKLKISAPYFSKTAIAKIEKIGGTILNKDETNSK